MEDIEERVFGVLKGVVYGSGGVDVIEAGHVHDVVATGGAVRVLLDTDNIPSDEQDELAEMLSPLVLKVEGVERVVVKPRPRPPSGRKKIPGVRHLLAVHSGKGGVGKSTVSVNLACSLAARGLKIGILDADVYGPSCPALLGLSGRAKVSENNGLIAPMEAHGVKLMSLGFMLPKSQALIWRGSLVDIGVPQLFRDVDWGELDILVVDLPPGTSDVHLAIAGSVFISAVIVVTAPGQTSIQDVQRGMEMFADLAVPCLGLVENMSAVACRRCGDVRPLFGSGGGSDLSATTGLPMLSAIPFFSEVADSAEKGRPIVIGEADSVAANVFNELADKVAGIIGRMETET